MNHIKKQRIYKFGCLLVHLLSLKFVRLTGYCSKVFKRLHSRKQKYKSKSSEASRNLGNYIRRKRCREFISVNYEIFCMPDFEIFGSWKKKDNNWLQQNIIKLFSKHIIDTSNQRSEHTRKSALYKDVLVQVASKLHTWKCEQLGRFFLRQSIQFSNLEVPSIHSA